MSELQQPEFETNIERKNVRVTREVGGRALIFDYMNTTLYDFPEPFTPFRHVFTQATETPTYIFEVEDSDTVGLYDELDAHNFPKIRHPYPSPQDEQARLGVDDAILSRDLEAFSQGELF